MGINPSFTANIKFHGGVGTVTGSKTKLQIGKANFLVDCGLFQGSKIIRSLNWQEFEGANKIDAVILTHAHVDHSGYLPKLVKEGFSGPIYCSHPTADLCRILLMDAAYLQEEDARFANRTKHSKYDPALPLYRVKDAERAINLLRPIDDGNWLELSEHLSVKMERAGHILGSRILAFDIHSVHKRHICTFSGDLGNGRSYIVKGPVNINESSIVVVESTYGNRIQKKTDPSVQLGNVINTVYGRQGVLVIPAFSVGRTQELLHLIAVLKLKGTIPKIKVYLDSPMSINATKIYKRYPEELQPFAQGDRTLGPLDFTEYEVVKSADDSMLLCMQDGPFVVISAAGMLTGGRILHHLKARLPDPNNTILFCGYQAAETKGRLLQNGIDKLRIHHQEVNVEASINSLEAISAHADQDELMQWLQSIKNVQKVFINHGEPEQSKALLNRIKKELSLDAKIPAYGDEFKLF
ncbi:MAG: MBL fold metallo-hydrolase RNA specificity domain-containing protein [Oligoflexales bacterium]